MFVRSPHLRAMMFFRHHPQLIGVVSAAECTENAGPTLMVRGLCRPNNGSSSHPAFGRKSLTRQYFSDRIQAVTAACYAAGLAVVTNYEAGPLAG